MTSASIWSFVRKLMLSIWATVKTKEDKLLMASQQEQKIKKWGTSFQTIRAWIKEASAHNLAIYLWLRSVLKRNDAIKDIEVFKIRISVMQ